VLNKKLLLAFLVLAFGLIACSELPPPMVIGTITAPVGSDVKGTIIMACNIKECTPGGISANAEVFTVDTTGLTAPWAIRLSTLGKYQVIAVNAAQGLIGVYKNPTTNSNIVDVGPFGAETSNVDITLVKGAVPARALDLFNIELSIP
jgi:hypothetical protein